jgi:hypothetical protein
MSGWVLGAFILLSLVLFGIIALLFKVSMDKQVNQHRKTRKKDDTV